MTSNFWSSFLQELQACDNVPSVSSSMFILRPMHARQVLNQLCSISSDWKLLQQTNTNIKNTCIELKEISDFTI